MSDKHIMPNIEKIFSLENKSICSKVYFEFHEEYEKVIKLYLFIVSSAFRLDKQREIALDALLKSSAENTSERLKLEEDMKIKSPNFKNLRKYNTLLSRYLVTNCADLFITYCKDIVKNAMYYNPSIIQDREFSMKLGEISNFRKMTDYRKYVIEEKIAKIADDIKNIESEMSKTVHIENILEPNKNPLIKIFINLRNVQVHKKGLIDKKFIRETPKHEKFQFVEGRKFHIDFDDFTILSENCLKTALRIDELISKKHKILRRKPDYWNKK
jgi:hypothetical protein